MSSKWLMIPIADRSLDTCDAMNGWMIFMTGDMEENSFIPEPL